MRVLAGCAVLAALCLVFPATAAWGLSPMPDQFGVIYVSMGGHKGQASVLYRMDPATGRMRGFFSFSRIPKMGGGTITHLRPGPKGRYLLFSSNAGWAYSPFRRNIFLLHRDGQRYRQITPGPNSGRFNQKCPCGRVSGKVLRVDGTPLSASPVFLSGVGMVQTKADGSFVFPRAPEGPRFIVAYYPGRVSYFEAKAIRPSRAAEVTVRLVPRSRSRGNLEMPAFFGNFLFFRFKLKSIVRFSGTGAYQTIYNAGGGCTMPMVGGLAVGSKSGSLAFIDYATGCTGNRGLYLAEPKARSIRLLTDFKSDPRICGVSQVFFSPDERFLAVKACLKTGPVRRSACLLVIDRADGKVKGLTCLSDQRVNFHNVNLHGFNPGGDWLLYSWHTGNPAQGNLSRVRLKRDGSVDQQQVHTLLQGQPILSATWLPGAGQTR